MRFRAAAVTLVLGAVLAACGGSAATPTPVPVTPAPPAPASAGASVTVKVNANTASAAELIAALEAAGVSNAERWADEIEEYRPYDAGDPSFSHLRDELAKYNPGEDVIDTIVSVLEP